MDFNIDVRKKQLENLDQLISSCSKRVESALKSLEWTADSLKKDDNLVQCPINFHHRISRKSWSSHIEKCLVKAEGYDLNEKFLSETMPISSQCIYLDRNKKIEVISRELTEKGPFRLAWNGLDPDPRTSDRLISTFSPSERLVFYNYAIENTKGPSPPPEYTTISNKTSEEKKTLLYEERLTQERDAKRRRIKYKSVHINRKNHTEVIREVINGQMEEYKDLLLLKQSQLKNKTDEPIKVNGEKKEDMERPHSSISRNSNSSSSSRRLEEKRRDRSRDRKDYRLRSRSRNRRRYSREREKEKRFSREKRSRRR